MKRFTILLVLIVLTSAASLMAQTPAGWKLHADGSTNAADPDRPGDIQFMSMGGGFHVVTPQAGVFWNPANTISGNYTLKGSFTLLKPSSHTNYYGLVFGGSDLEGAGQRYTYFLVAQNGTWILKHRNGDVASDVVGRTQNAAVRRPDASGRSVNDLEVRVAADKIDYLVNNTVVHSMPKTAATVTDGIWGFRVNHELEVQVNGLSVAPLAP
jgi:hypothetical protein